MKFAFSTLAAPKWDFDTVAARAAEYGYDGVEIRGFLNESALTASNVFLSDARKVREIFRGAAVEIACLSSSVSFSMDRRKDARSAMELMRYVEMAQALDCRYVKMFDMEVRPGQSRAQAASALGSWLLAMGDFAADRDVTILVENALSFKQAKELWNVLEMIAHPAVAVCWDVFNAALVGESPAISVPTLNNRIQYTQVKDALMGPLGANFCRLGEGQVKVQDFIRRLKGIGYTGWMTFEWEKAWLVNLLEPEVILPDAIAKLKEWSRPQIAEESETKESDAHPASAR